MGVARFEVHLVRLAPTVRSEIQKTRPCVAVSPYEMNARLRTIIVAPMTTAIRSYPSRVDCEFRGQQGQVVLDQIRTIDSSRPIRKLGELDHNTSQRVLDVLQRMFAP